MEREIREKIKGLIDSNDVVLFMKGSKHMPSCGFSARASGILQNVGVDFESVNVFDDQEIWAGVKEFSDWPTIPQLYIKGEFIGGGDIMYEMYENGEWPAFLKQKGITANPPAESA